MAEVAQQYRIINPASLEDLANQLNRTLALMADRIDALEGYRGTPTFRAEMDMQSHKITNADTATNNQDAVIKGQLTDIDHGSLQGLADDDHIQYVKLAGRSGGQTLKGGTAASENLTLESTADVAKGYIECKDNLKLFDSNSELIHGFLKS